MQFRRSVNHAAGLLCQPCTRAVPAMIYRRVLTNGCSLTAALWWARFARYYVMRLQQNAEAFGTLRTP